MAVLLSLFVLIFYCICPVSQNITLARLKERGICYLTPMPSEMPKANLLKQGLREVGIKRFIVSLWRQPGFFGNVNFPDRTSFVHIEGMAKNICC